MATKKAAKRVDARKPSKKVKGKTAKGRGGKASSGGGGGG